MRRNTTGVAGYRLSAHCALYLECLYTDGLCVRRRGREPFDVVVVEFPHKPGEDTGDEDIHTA